MDNSSVTGMVTCGLICFAMKMAITMALVQIRSTPSYYYYQGCIFNVGTFAAILRHVSCQRVERKVSHEQVRFRYVNK